MPRKRYGTISLPQELLDRIEEVVDSGKFGYASASEFVKEAIRERLRELGYKA